jgi:hydroxysqualene dehydroxylase
VSGIVHVVGGGLAGLAAAVALVRRGVPVVLSESAGQAGGRCRSYYDSTLGGVIDNGNHLVLSGNRAVRDYLRDIGAENALKGPKEAEFPFVDLADDSRWTIRLNRGALPWWIFSPGRRVPGTCAKDYLRCGALVAPPARARIGEVVPCEGPLWRKLMQPLLKAVLNTEPREASATLAAAVLREILMRGGKACRPRIAFPSLAAAFVEPALKRLADGGAEVRFNKRLRRIALKNGRVTALDFAGETDVLDETDTVILATPPWVTTELMPGILAPNAFRAIVNAHFRMQPPKDAPPLLGVIGGTAEWIFALPERISVTISAAEAIIDTPRDKLAERIWRNVARAFALPSSLPPWQIVKEKRATFAATPEQALRRPPTQTLFANLLLAGDWIDTGLPATVESALRSGRMAAAAALDRSVY